MAETDFVRYGVDMKGDSTSAERVPLERIRVQHPMTPDPAIDNAFPFRAPDNPSLVLARFAGTDGQCHPRVRVKEVTFAAGQLASVKAICKREKIHLTEGLMGKLKASVSAEMNRLVKGKALTEPRLKVRRLEVGELPAHEKSLAGQLGTFVDLRAPQRGQHTLRNGKILALYAGAVFEKGKDPGFTDSSGRGTEYDMALSSKKLMTA